MWRLYGPINLHTELKKKKKYMDMHAHLTVTLKYSVQNTIHTQIHCLSSTLKSYFSRHRAADINSWADLSRCQVSVFLYAYLCVCAFAFSFFFYCGERDESRECRQALFNPCVYALPCHISANRRRNFKDGLEISPRVEPLNIPAVQTIVSRACPNWPNKRVGIFVILPWNGPSFEFWKYAFRWIIWFRGHLMSSGLTTMEKPKGTGCVILFSTLWWLQIIKLWIKG